MDFLIFRGGANFRQGSGITKEKEVEIWRSLVYFLEKNQLLVRKIDFSDPLDMEGVELRSSALSNLGMAVIRCGFDKWLRSIDRGKSPSDTTILEKCLGKQQTT